MQVYYEKRKRRQEGKLAQGTAATSSASRKERKTHVNNGARHASGTPCLVRQCTCAQHARDAPP